MTSVSPDLPSAKPAIERWEWVILGGLLLIAMGFRFAFPGRLAIEHFDEGVYASNIWFGDSREGTYPAQHLYAPPLLPTLIELCFLVSGPSNAAAMWPNQVAGVVSVLLLWWLGRSWFGPVAGLVAAGLCATNEVLILLSRSALTDSLLGMWWLAALWALRRACDSGNALDRLLAGLLIGLAWFTKYNGWMPLGIVIGAVVLRAGLCRGIWTQTRTALMSCLITGVVAFAVWSPWLWSLQSKGGYASVAANHRQYIVGFAGWGTSFTRQFQQLQAMQGPVSESALFVCLLLLLIWVTLSARPSGTAVVSPAGSDSTLPPMRIIPKGFPIGRWWVVYALFALSPMIPLAGFVALSVYGLSGYWGRDDRSRAAPDRGDRLNLGYWILLVWFLGLLVATPLYRPYLRLTLPWLLAASLGAGLVLQQAWSRMKLAAGERLPHESGFRPIEFLLIFVLTVLAGVVPWRSQTVVAGGKARHESFQRALPDQSQFVGNSQLLARQLTAVTAAPEVESPLSVVYVYAEPSLLFELRLAGLQNVAPVSSLQFARSQFSSPAARIYLAVGIHALNDPQFREQFAAARGQFKPVGRRPWQLGPLVALDQSECDPQLLGRNPLESATIELYEVLAPEN